MVHLLSRSRTARWIAALACSLSTAAAFGEAPAPTLHFDLSAGVGVSYDTAGVRGEIRYGQFAAGLGVGYSALPGDSPSTAHGNVHTAWLHGLAASARWLSQDGEGLDIAFNIQATEQTLTNDYLTFAHAPEQQLRLAALIGWRWRWSHFFLEAAAGPIVNYEYTWQPSDEPDVVYARKGWRLGLGNELSSTSFWWLPAVELGAGWTF